MPRTAATLRSRSAIAAMLAVHTALVGYSGWVHAPVMDELGHLAAGVSHWEFGRFGVCTDNAPLVRMVAARPALGAGAKTDMPRAAIIFRGQRRPGIGRGDEDDLADALRAFGQPWPVQLA